jgi:hypothetical protein
MADKEFVYKITGQNDSKGTDEAKSKLDQLTGSLGESARATGLADSKMLALTAKLAGAAGAMYALKKAVDFASSSLTEFGEQEGLDFKQEAVIKATGEAAGKTASELKGMASALSEATSISDEDIERVQTLLLTFREIKGDIYDSAVKASLDLGAIFGSAESAALQLGKALQDPTLGVTMLSRSGVTFNEVQKEQIKAFVEQNDLLSAQKLILEEVQKQVSGTAEAMGSGYTGSVDRMKNAWGDFKQALGGTIASLGVIQNVMGSVTDTLRGLESALAIPKSTAEFVDRVGVDLKKSADEAAAAFDRLQESSAKALDVANAKADAQTEKVKKRIEAEKELALAQLDLEKIQKGMPESEYQQKKADIMGVAAHDTYGVDRESLQRQQIALESEMQKLDAAAKEEQETAKAYYNHLVSRRAQYDKLLAESKSKISELTKQISYPDLSDESLSATIGTIQAHKKDLGITTPNNTEVAYQKELALRDQIRKYERQQSRSEEKIKSINAKSPSAYSAIEAAGIEATAYRANVYAPGISGIDEASSALEMQRKINDAKIERERVDARQKSEKERAEETERRRKEAEERDAKMQPGERLGRLTGGAEVRTNVGGFDYQNVEGTAAAQAAIQKAGADIIAGKDDFQIISQLIAKLQEMGAVFRGGYTQLANELNRLDGDIKDVKSIQKASRQ